MKEIATRNQFTEPRLGAIAQEFDSQKESNDPFRLIRNTFGDYKRGPVLLALGGVGGNGASTKAEGILEQFDLDKTPFKVAAMKKYLAANPLIDSYLKKNGINVIVVEDGVDMNTLYENCEKAVAEIASKGMISGVLSLGPRTYYPEAARRQGLQAMMIDGAVPDKWEDTIDQSTGYPDTAYASSAYNKAVYATTCGFTGWMPPKGTYPGEMDLKVIQQPFSDRKNSFLKQLRDLSPQEARFELMQRGVISSLDGSSTIIVPTMDQVYLNPEALVTNGGFMTTEQFGQGFSFMSETIISAAKLAEKSGEKVSIYLRPGVITDMMSSVVRQYGENLIVLTPQDEIVTNEDWLLLRKAGVAIGRAPLCVSTAEALGMGDYQVTAAVPGVTSDGVSYMTENAGLTALNRRGISKVLFPGEPLLPAIQEVIVAKGL